MKDILKIIGIIAAYLFGDFTVLLQVLATITAIDLITGFLKVAISDEIEFDAKKAAKGPLKILMMFAVIAMAHQLDRAVPIEQAMVMTSTIGFYIVKQSMSVLGNVGESGLPFPDLIGDFLQKFIANKK